jgi:hypothetical protein
MLPALSHADCIPSGASGDDVPFTLVTLKNNQVAGYATGTMTLTETRPPAAISSTTTLAASAVPKLFSNRLTCTDSSKPCLDATQPFAVSEPDNINVTVTESTGIVLGKGLVTTIVVTVKDPHAGTNDSFTGTCSNTNELYGTYESNTFAVLAFGTPVTPPPLPK